MADQHDYSGLEARMMLGEELKDTACPAANLGASRAGRDLQSTAVMSDRWQMQLCPQRCCLISPFFFASQPAVL